MPFNESSLPDPTDIECLKKALGLPSICLATTVNGVQCGTPISHKEEIDPILSSLLKPSHTTTPVSFLSHTDQLLSRLLWDPLCPSRSQHSAPSKNILSLDTLRDRFQKWKLSEEKEKANDEASTAGVDGCHESQTSALGEGFQRDTSHDVAFDSEKDDEHDEEDEDIDEDDASSHSEYQPSEYQSNEYEPSEYQPSECQFDEYRSSEYQSNEYEPSEQQNDKHSKDRTNNALDGKPTEVPKNEVWERLDEQLKQSRETLLHATDDQGPTSLATPPRTTYNSSKSASGSKDEPNSISEASTPVPPIFSPSEPSVADTPDTEKTSSPTGRRDSDTCFESPSLNRGSSARSGKGLSFPPPTLSLLQPKTPESHDEERPTTPSNSKNQEPAGKGSTRRGRSISTDKASARKLLHPSRTLSDGTKTAEIYEISTKPNALKEVLMTMRSIADGNRAMPGHVYAYKHKSVPGHIKIGYAKDEQISAEKWHIVLEPVGKHKDLHLWERLEKQEDDCMSGLEVLFAVYMPYAAGHMERLVHRTLYKEKRIAKCQKPECDVEHMEWFNVGKQRALEVVMRWAEFSGMFPYNSRGCLGENWDEHAFEYVKQSTSMKLEYWWDVPWKNTLQKLQHSQQLAAALEEQASSQQEETSLLDVQLKIQLERNRLQQEKNELEQYATTLREEKVKRDLERTRERQQELQQRIEKLSLR